LTSPPLNAFINRIATRSSLPHLLTQFSYSYQYHFSIAL
jgi:hypothetical protein